MFFEDRKQAGEILAERLAKYKNKKDALVLAIPRGGVETGYYLAKNLWLKLDIVITKKIGAPYNQELAVGAVGPDKTVYLNQDVIDLYGIPENYIKKEIENIGKLVREKYKFFRGSKKPPAIKNKTIILTDDGIATGATILAAAHYIKNQRPGKLVIAVPVCPEDTLLELKKIADEVICLSTNLIMGAVGACYKNFPQVTDTQVKDYLKS